MGVCGVVDLLGVVPTCLSIVIEGFQSLLVIRALRPLRVFRVFRLDRHLGEAKVLQRALKASRPKITAFLWTVLTIVLFVGALMYMIEGEKGGFTSIPRSVYWAIVTMTTVGYGDIAPQSVLGQSLAAALLIVCELDFTDAVWVGWAKEVPCILTGRSDSWFSQFFS